MSERSKSLWRLLSAWFLARRTELRASMWYSLMDDVDVAEAARYRNPDFRKWLRGDPRVTTNPASLYGDDATGFPAGREEDNRARDMFRR